jgi:MoaA/NifB/PqqE/SkfB family radical SAM enzyme
MQLTYAYLETTSYCNVDCKFCNRKEVINGSTHMTVEQFDLLLKQIEKQPITDAKLMGMGEPFMHPQFNTITRRFRETFPDAFVISATNCQVALNERFKDAVKYLDMCYLSIDGGKENYEDIRFGSSWDKLHKFLRNLADFKSEVKCTFPINFTVTPQNVFDIDILLMVNDMYSLDGLRINFVQNWDEDKSAVGLLNGFTEGQIDYLKQYKQYFKGKTPWTYSDCFWVKNGLYVTVDGNVKVCCMNTSAKPLGNLFQQPLQLIRASIPMRTIASGCATNQPTEHCKNCSYKELDPFLAKIL